MNHHHSFSWIKKLRSFSRAGCIAAMLVSIPISVHAVNLTNRNPAWTGFAVAKWVWGQRQDAGNYCGPASAQTMLTHDLGASVPTEAQLASAMHTGSTGSWPWYFASALNKYTPGRHYDWALYNIWPYGENLYNHMKARFAGKNETASIVVSASLYGLGGPTEAHWVTLTGSSPNYNTHHTWQVWDNREKYGNWHHLSVRDWPNYWYASLLWGGLAAAAVFPTD